MKKFFIVLVTHFCLVISLMGQQHLADYFGQRPPGDTPLLFAPGVVSDGLANRDFATSPNADEIFYTVQQRDFAVSMIMCIKKINGKWLKPEVATFSGIYNDLEPAFTIDGKKLFFSSNRPANPVDSIKDYDIWYMEKKNGQWVGPINAGGKVNSTANEFYPSLAANGNLYFTTEFKNGKGKEDIVMCEWRDGQYQPPSSLPEAINSAGYEFNAFIDPTEKFILFTGYGRKDDMGKGDLYISLKDNNGHWQPAVNLGASINSTAIDYCPFVSRDNKYLFFTSSRITYKSPFAKQQTILDLRNGLQSPGNGLDDIYWVRFDTILEKIRNK